MTFYGSPATGAGWIVPRKYVERVGDEGFKKAPVGRAPIGSSPSHPAWSSRSRPTRDTGARLPTIKRIVFKVVPDEATRLARSSAARWTSSTPSAARWPTRCVRTPGLTVKPTLAPFT